METRIKQEESYVGSLMEDGDVGMNGIVVLGIKERGKGKEMCDMLSQGKWKGGAGRRLLMTIKSAFMKSSSPFLQDSLLSTRLTEICHNLLKISLSPSVPRLSARYTYEV